MRAILKAKFSILLSLFFMLSFIPFTQNVIGDPFDDTILSISPSSQTVDAGENFTIDIYCITGQPIKAFEFRISFDETLISADSVTDGDIFSNFSTFSNSGTINNSSGTIVDIYSLIVGPGNVSDNGTFATISFTAKEFSGTSQIEFLDVGKWTGVTNETGYIPITVYSGSVEVIGGSSPPPPPPPPSGGGGGAPPIYEENNPPETPLKPSGPTYIEIGTEYTYSSSAIDPDSDQIRIRFDWGDGNLSDWSEFVDSNTTVSMSHNWTEISTFKVRAIAQDIHGLNSSWSTSLNVTISQTELGIPPVVIIDISGNNSVNDIIYFDASKSYDPDGTILSYEWDFGDGKTGIGPNTSHSYSNPGEYTVTLIVTDNNGTIYSKSIMINIAIKQEDMKSGEQWIIMPFNITMLIFGSIISVIVCIIVLFRHKITIKILRYKMKKINKRINKHLK